MKYILLCFFVLIAHAGLGQFNFNAAVNVPAMGMIYNPAPAEKVTIDYGIFGIALGAGIVKNNIKGNFDDLVESITVWVATYRYSGGNAGSRYTAAKEVVRQILARSGRIVVNGKDVSFFSNEQFANDLRMFQDVAFGAASIYVQDSPDAAIPFRLIANYPLAVVNGQRQPIVINDTKSIRIK